MHRYSSPFSIWAATFLDTQTDLESQLNLTDAVMFLNCIQHDPMKFCAISIYAVGNWIDEKHYFFGQTDVTYMYIIKDQLNMCTADL